MGGSSVPETVIPDYTSTTGAAHSSCRQRHPMSKVVSMRPVMGLEVIGSARIGCPGKPGQLDGDVGSPARRHHVVPVVELRADEQLAALSSVESGTNLQGLVDGYGGEIANRQFAGEGRLLQSADHESRDVVESGGHDSAVRTTGCTFERPPKDEVGDHLVALELHRKFDARRIGVAADRPVLESAPAQVRLAGAGPPQSLAVTSRRLADRTCQCIDRLRHGGKRFVPMNIPPPISR